MSRKILSPPIICMGPSRRYRVNIIHNDFKNRNIPTGLRNGTSMYEEPDLYGENINDNEDDEKDDTYQIKQLPNGSFELSMHVAPCFYGGLIGYKGATKKRIARETGTELVIPPSNIGATADTMVVIKGKTRASVIAAKHQIHTLLTSLRQRMNVTHFYGVALNYGEIRDNFITFRKEILSAKIPGIEESLFQTDACLHLTFGICKLMDNVERKKASEVLISCREFLNDLRTPFQVRVQGLEIMNDDPHAVKILYARIQASLDLQAFADRCYNCFQAFDFGKDPNQYNRVKLHMTLMNARYRTRSMSTDNKEGNLNHFDASEILKRWGNYDFGTVQCKEMVLCVLSGDNQSKINKFYQITSTLKF